MVCAYLLASSSVKLCLPFRVRVCGLHGKREGGDKKRGRGDKGGRRSNSREGRECRGVSKGGLLPVGLRLLLARLDRVGGLGFGRVPVLGFLDSGLFSVGSCFWPSFLVFRFPFNLGNLGFWDGGKGVKGAEKDRDRGLLFCLRPPLGPYPLPWRYFKTLNPNSSRIFIVLS